ncbi:hypothetical protein IV487_01695 [Enterococcus saccharolyticus]|uniref:hypothetical protein n=1 Tax=Enterococcus saccharolyticus TaxID=41997 RepID=UPI001E315A6F|nr:hypothetical protein [Enterococcus saccharolyticus]MCD5001176.1 hypothetical protein [Enterococcus saccharolyticus]
MLDDFKQQYIDKCINGAGFDEELNQLFDDILVSEFGDDPVLMDEFIQSIIDENQPREPTEIELLKQENMELKQRQEMTEEALLMLSDMMLGGV